MDHADRETVRSPRSIGGPYCPRGSHNLWEGTLTRPIEASCLMFSRLSTLRVAITPEETLENQDKDYGSGNRSRICGKPVAVPKKGAT